MSDIRDCSGMGVALAFPAAKEAAASVLISEGLISSPFDLPKKWWKIAMTRRVEHDGEMFGVYFKMAPVNSGRHGTGYMIVKTDDFDRRVMKMFEEEEPLLHKARRHRTVGDPIKSTIDEDMEEEFPDEGEGKDFEGFKI